MKHKPTGRTGVASTEEIAQFDLEEAEKLDELGYDEAQFLIADAKERLRICKINRELEEKEDKEYRAWKGLLKKRRKKSKKVLDKPEDLS
jgi:hypothetical protein